MCSSRHSGIMQSLNVRKYQPPVFEGVAKGTEKKGTTKEKTGTPTFLVDMLMGVPL